MLVLSRQRDETIMIGDEIEITIVDIRGEKIRLGITAPTHIAVHRKEIYEAIKRENAQAARLERSELDGVARQNDDARSRSGKVRSRVAALATEPVSRRGRDAGESPGHEVRAITNKPSRAPSSGATGH